MQSIEFIDGFPIGLIVGGIFRLRKYTLESCFLTLGFWYVFGATFLVCIVVFVNDNSALIGFLLGFFTLLAKDIFNKVTDIFNDVVYFFNQVAYTFERFSNWRQERNDDRQQRAEEQQHRTTNQPCEEENRRAEQRRREEEARYYRQQHRRQQGQQKQQQTGQEKEIEQDTRTPEEILGLLSGWTKDDLKTAYRREAQRLHPDRWTGKPQAIRAEMEKEFKEVQSAYKKLNY